MIWKATQKIPRVFVTTRHHYSAMHSSYLHHPKYDTKYSITNLINYFMAISSTFYCISNPKFQDNLCDLTCFWSSCSVLLLCEKFVPKKRTWRNIVILWPQNNKLNFPLYPQCMVLFKSPVTQLVLAWITATEDLTNIESRGECTYIFILIVFVQSCSGGQLGWSYEVCLIALDHEPIPLTIFSIIVQFQ